MADGKTFPLSIIIKALDQATAPLRDVSTSLRGVTTAGGGLGQALRGISGQLTFGNALAGLTMVGNVVGGLISGFRRLGGVIASAISGLKGILDEFDSLGDTAERIGVPVDTLAQLRYAAGQSGAEIGALDTGLDHLNKTMGEFAARTGRAFKFVGMVSPDLQKMLTGAKGLDEFLGIVADATKKLSTGKAIKLLASLGLGPEMLPLMKKGSAGIEELMARSAQLTGPLAEAAKAGGAFDAAMKDLDASVLGVKATIAEALGPVLTDLVQRFTAFVGEHKAEIAEFIKSFAEKLPGAIKWVIAAVGDIIDAVKTVGPVLLSIGKEVWTFFKTTGELIAAIAQGIVDAVLAVEKALMRLGELTGGSVVDLARRHIVEVEGRKNLGITQAMGAFAAPPPAKAEVTLTIANASPGDRAKIEPGATAAVNLNVGYQLNPGLW